MRLIYGNSLTLSILEVWLMKKLVSLFSSLRSIYEKLTKT